MIELLVLALAAAVIALLCLWLVLRFLQHVYDRGGIADLKVAATAVRHVCLGLAVLVRPQTKSTRTGEALAPSASRCRRPTRKEL